MKKIIPFEKEIILKTQIAEVTSISLEHSLKKEEDNKISGEFLLDGEYKISDTSVNTEIFSYNLPFDIHMDERYILDDSVVDIYDFYYEIVNDNVLKVHIEVSVANLKEAEILESVREITPIEDIVDKEELEPVRESKIDITNKEVEKETNVNVTEKISTIFKDDKVTDETYSTYKVYIVRENDSIEYIMDLYHISKEELELYNDLKELKIGDKLIIPHLVTNGN